MNDVISRAKILYELRDLGNTWFGTFAYDGISMSIVKVKQAPALEMVDVVRCKDCKHSVASPNPKVPDDILKCYCSDSPCTHRLVKGDDFCNYGERRI